MVRRVSHGRHWPQRSHLSSEGTDGAHRLSSLGWKRWAPVQAGAFAAHLLSGLAITWENTGRTATQEGVAGLNVYKTAVTLTGAAVTLYAGILAARWRSSRLREPKEQPSPSPVHPMNSKLPRSN